MASFWITTCPRRRVRIILLWSLPIMNRTCEFQSCRIGSETGLTGESFSITTEVTVPRSLHLPVPTQPIDNTATMGSGPVAGHNACAVSTFRGCSVLSGQSWASHCWFGNTQTSWTAGGLGLDINCL